MLGYLIDIDGMIDRGGRLIPGVDRFVDGLREANIPFLVLAGTGRRECHDVAARLRRLGLDVTPYHIFRRAGSAAGLRAAREELAIPADQTVVVGDSEAAILGGVRLQYRTILVLGGRTRAGDLDRHACRPDRVVPSFADLDPHGLEAEFNAARGALAAAPAAPLQPPSHRPRRRPLAATSF
ncbi:UMP phosphatase [Aquisphaera giovannonii]|uniref:UMP phosphatase n=1 Tax=Aquisphaera giovannonii TaxID=406548 RepID=A0A5B9W722_9BACT|nr:HAD hydrolase-like protein [Aquisphaera giovannonii]QEH35730.1 UMP phosphatase [Aquisphaera giovannonii]